MSDKTLHTMERSVYIHVHVARTLEKAVCIHTDEREEIVVDVVKLRHSYAIPTNESNTKLI